jgi:hypothetical protein
MACRVRCVQYPKYSETQKKPKAPRVWGHFGVSIMCLSGRSTPKVHSAHKEIALARTVGFASEKASTKVHGSLRPARLTRS